MTARHPRGPKLFLSDVRFVFSDPSSSDNNLLELPVKESHYLRDVLRLEVGDYVEVGDASSGTIGECSIISLGERVVLRVQRVLQPQLTTSPSIVLLCALCKGDKNDRICDWATELGCDTIIFWQSARSIVRLRDEKECLHKAERLNTIALAAAQQSKQLRPPKVSVHRSLEAALLSIENLPNAHKLLCSSESGVRSLYSIELATPPSSFILAIGPEGAFAPEEYSHLVDARGFTPISLGESTLRSELAAVTAITSLRSLLWHRAQS